MLRQETLRQEKLSGQNKASGDLQIDDFVRSHQKSPRLSPMGSPSEKVSPDLKNEEADNSGVFY